MTSAAGLSPPFPVTIAPTSSVAARSGSSNPAQMGALPGGGRRHDRKIWRPLPGAGRRDRTDQEGPEPKRIVILEFPDKAAFKRWYDCAEYQKILPGQLDDSISRAFVVEGVSWREETEPQPADIRGLIPSHSNRAKRVCCRALLGTHHAVCRCQTPPRA